MEPLEGRAKAIQCLISRMGKYVLMCKLEAAMLGFLLDEMGLGTYTGVLKMMKTRIESLTSSVDRYMCMCTCVCTCVCACVCTCVYMCVHVSVCTCMYVYMFVCVLNALGD